MAKAVSQVEFHTADVSKALSFVSISKPDEVQAGHVVVHLTVRPIHPYDLYLVRSSAHIGNVGKDGPVVPGSEGFGIVEMVGEGVSSVKKGDRVIPVLLWSSLMSKGIGSWQEYIELPEEDVLLVPDEVSDDAAAQFVINPWTAYGLLKDLSDEGLDHGAYILQTAAGSVLGRMVIQLARHWGIKTISLVRREELKEELKALGADEVINTSNEDVVARVKEITNGVGAYGAIEMVGGSQSKLAAACVRNGGKLFCIGSFESRDVTITLNDLLRKVQLRGWTLHDFVADKQRKQQLISDMLQFLKNKVITPMEGYHTKLDDFLDAIAQSEKPSRGGKVFLVN